ncbi:MAG: hypothetical protein ACJ73D_11135 [Pyrinomonadaceae bacterium]
MFRRLFFVLCLVSLSAGVSIAQARRTVTNSDLDKYRQQRVAAERELREDYARLGFASPEEIARRNAESQQQLFDLSQRLKADRLEHDRLELQREQMFEMIALQSSHAYRDTVEPGDQFLPTEWGSGGGVFGGNGFGGNGFGRRHRGQQSQGYFAGGQFWPQGPRTAVRPLIAVPHVAPHH